MLIPRRNPLRRYYGEGDLHFITSSCYRRRPLLGSARARDVFLDVFEQVRRRYQFDVIGFVVMPDHVGAPGKRRRCGCWGGHIHLLISEPEKDNPSVVMQVLKQTVARRLLRRTRKRNAAQGELWKEAPYADRFWQRRFYDFNVFSEAKRIEKLEYMHHNPVKRGPGRARGVVGLE